MWIAGALNPQVVIDGFTTATGAHRKHMLALLSQREWQINLWVFDAFFIRAWSAFWAYMGWYARRPCR